MNPILPVIDVNHLCKNYAASEESQVLKDVDLKISEGEFHVLLGLSGCGKSTLLNSIAGFLKITSGEILIDGKPAKGPGNDRGVVFQSADRAIFPWLTVQKNVEYGPKVNKIRKKQREEIADKYIELVGLGEHRDKYPDELSGGMKQRLQIARALANNSRILIMDEPFGALDAHTRRIMQDELIKLWEETGKTILFVTHDITEAILLGQKIHIMSPAPHATIYKTYNVDFPYPRKETGREFDELYENLKGHFDFGAGI